MADKATDSTQDATPAPEKIANKRYDDVLGMKPGDVAKEAVYRDSKSGKLSTKEPVEGELVVAEGRKVTESDISRLNA